MAEIATLKVKLPKQFIVGLIILCALPFLFDWIYDQFNVGINLSAIAGEEHSNRGQFLHLILEWTGVIIAFSTAIFAVLQFRITGNEATPVIGLALFCAGTMDAFHALAASNLIYSLSDPKDFIPFTWAISRIFNALILIIGVTVFLFYRRLNKNKKASNWRFLMGLSLAFMAISYITIAFCANSETLPNTMFSDTAFARPYDLVPLVLFFTAAVYFLPKFYKKNNSIFAHSLMWSMLPAIVTQLHMAFGSSHLFDAHFNNGHFLKVIFYMVPFTGIAFDYFNTYKKNLDQIKELNLQNKALEQKNKNLEEYTYITSHDLQEPLHTISSFSELLQNEHSANLDEQSLLYLSFIEQGSERMKALIKSLLDHGRIGLTKEKTKVNLNDILTCVKSDLTALLNESGASIISEKLPIIWGFEEELTMLFQNLIENSVKYKNNNRPCEIQIFCTKKKEMWEIEFKDNGIGFDPIYAEKIFAIFQRLHLKEESKGTGIGLAHCRKIVRKHGGEIWATSIPGEGANFHFTLPG